MRIQEGITEETVESDDISEFGPVLLVRKNYQKIVAKAGKGKNKDRGPVRIWVWSALVRQIALSPRLSSTA